MPFDNDQALNAALLGEMAGIIDEVVFEVLKELKKKISEILYDTYSPSFYNRQGSEGGILGVFEINPTEVGGNSVSAEIEDRPETLANDPASFVHGSYYYEGGTDITGMMVDLIVEGWSGPLFGPAFEGRPRDFWTPFIELLENGYVFELVEKEFKKRGIKFIRI